MHDLDDLDDDDDLDQLDEDDESAGESAGDLSGWNIDIDQLRGWEKLIADDEADAIAHRWEFGRAMLDSRGDRQRLPKGALAATSAATGVGRRDIQYRMALVDKFPQKTSATALRLSWREIVGQYLTGKPNSKPKRKPKLPKKPGKVLDGATVLQGRDVVKVVRGLKTDVFQDRETVAAAAFSREESDAIIREFVTMTHWLQDAPTYRQHNG
jgi:hypothetical protein